MRLLIVGAPNEHIAAASQIAMKRGAKVSVAPSIDGAMELMRSGKSSDLVFIDIHQDIAAFIAQLEREHIYVPVIACGVETDAASAVKAIKAGAKEYIPLPPDEGLIAAVLMAVTDEQSTIIHRSDATKKVVALATQIAPSDANILITGETGTGKEVMARFLHAKSRRADQPFVTVNCAAIPENLLESEMFGHEKGAFTGALTRRVGKFEEANHGTLLLDEISEMDIRLQAKLLRAIQEKEIDRVGGSKPVKLNIRILATSNRNLAEEVKKGTFREDLLFRLNIFSLNLPPLRDRLDDIDDLCVHFIKKYAKPNGVPERPLSPEALKLLKTYSWPGNIRELENTMYRAVLLSTGASITPDAIMFSHGHSPANHNMSQAPDTQNATGLVGRTAASVEQELIIETLRHCLGNRTHAANILGISIRTLRNKLNEYTSSGIDVPASASGQSEASDG